MQPSLAAQHVQCLDLFRVEHPLGHDCAILIEIWDTGGLLQTNVAIPENSAVHIPSIAHGVSAKVVSCQQDEYGFLVQFAIEDCEWFPRSYSPPYLLSQQGLS